MAVTFFHIRHQGPVLATVAKAAVSGLKMKRKSSRQLDLPGKVFRAELSPRNKMLVRDFVHTVGGDPEAYGENLPPHFFPQWAVPVMSKVLEQLPYNMVSVLNAGCEVFINQPMPMDEPIFTATQLTNIDDNGRRLLLTVEMHAGTKSAPDALKVIQTSIIKRSSSGSKSGKKVAKRSEPDVVPETAKHLGSFSAAKNAGLDYALLTGDFNPLHWVPWYARMFGYKNSILHGFASMGHVVEVLNKAHFDGGVDHLKRIRLRFVKPIVLPAELNVYMDEATNSLYVGKAPGQAAYLKGDFDGSSVSS